MLISREKLICIGRRLYKQLFSKATSFIHLQLFITALSWPFLIASGLPLSKAFLIGNILFAPFLILFLIFSLGIFLCEFIPIPPLFFTIPLELLTSLFRSVVITGQRSWLFSLPHTSYWVYLPFFIAIGAVLHYRPLTKPFWGIAWLSGLMVVFIIALRSTIPTTEVQEPIPYFSKELCLIYSSKKAVLINPGSRGRGTSGPSHVLTTLIPLLRKRGITELDLLVCTHPSSLNFLSSAVLIKALPVRKIFLPSWKGTLSNRGWSSWEKLLSIAKSTQTTLIQGTAETSFWSSSLPVGIELSAQCVQKNGLRYPACNIHYRSKF